MITNNFQILSVLMTSFRYNGDNPTERNFYMEYETGALLQSKIRPRLRTAELSYRFN